MSLLIIIHEKQINIEKDSEKILVSIFKERKKICYFHGDDVKEAENNWQFIKNAYPY
jgi:hypothetical protein